jgi:glutamate decarboxylase
LWRDAAALPEELIFNVNYLGGQMPTFALNFSRPGAEIVAQYYAFFRLGREGYREVQQACRDVAMYLAAQIEALPEFRLISRGDQLPVLAFTTSDTAGGWDVFAASSALRERGWQVPAYTFPENRTDLAVLRIVCRNGFSHDMADLLLDDLRSAVSQLTAEAVATQRSGPAGFRH